MGIQFAGSPWLWPAFYFGLAALVVALLVTVYCLVIELRTCRRLSRMPKVRELLVMLLFVPAASGMFAIVCVLQWLGPYDKDGDLIWFPAAGLGLAGLAVWALKEHMQRNSGQDNEGR